MCFSQYTQYVPRPVTTNGAAHPSASITTALAADPNIFGMLAADAEEAAHCHEPTSAATGGSTVESVIVSLPDGRRLLITPLD